MILKDNFYNILEAEAGAETIRATIRFNEDHPIFQGHFPGQPVVPGVCMLQVVKEFVITAIGKPILLSKGSDLKFLAVIDPRQHPLVNAEINLSHEQDDSIAVTGRLFYGETIFFKFKGFFKG